MSLGLELRMFSYLSIDDEVNNFCVNIFSLFPQLVPERYFSQPRMRGRACSLERHQPDRRARKPLWRIYRGFNDRTRKLLFSLPLSLKITLLID